MLSLTRQAVDIGIVVADLDSSLTFYRDTLGLPVCAENTVRGIGRVITLGAGEARVKLADPDASVTQGTVAGGVRGRAAGLRYCTFPVGDADEVLGRCVRAGCKVVMPPVTVAGCRVAAVADPDGNWIEFLSAAPDPIEEAPA